MAEASVQFLLDRVSSLIEGEIGLIMGVDQEIINLSSTLSTIQAVLEDAEHKQFESTPIQDWLCKLNDLTFEIDDILDEYAMEVSKSENKDTFPSCCSFRKISFRHEIGRRMKEVTGKLDMIAAEREKFHLREVGVESRSHYAATRETGSVLNESQVVYGRDEEKEKIVDILVNQIKDCEQLSVFPIKGIGGLGKTTLAQMVFNDEEVIGHFDAKIWVCVSDNFDAKTLIKQMIESLTGSTSDSDLTSVDALHCRLRELLNQRRYLLVLDDVWDDIVGEKWDMVRNVITCGSTGAAVLLTTRLAKVAEIIGTIPAHSIGELSEEDCWLLFKERSFGQEKEEYANLESIGKQIVKKCGGVPLAAKALGGLLRFKRTEKEWIYVKDSEIWNIPQEETSLLPALRLSYHHLPIQLRRCFTYCAVFPKDSLIWKEDLIFLWMAHGYISSNGNREEDIGNDIWNELVLRSLFQDEETTDRGITFTTMHDLVHDLARSVLENKVTGQFKSKDKIRQVNLRTRHVAFPSSLRLEIDLSFSLMNLSSLRILDASKSRIDNIPSTISKLKHLRYLNLSFTEIRSLPNAICSLWNLKILNLSFCFKLVGLPKHMRFLKNLRHLLLERCESLSEMPPKIGELRSLKTLCLFVVGHGKGSKLGELQFLNLGGKLSIRHLERVESHIEAIMANLSKKENLRELRLVWESENKSKLMENMEEKVLQALEPHPNLQILEISGFHGQYLPHLSKLPYLKVLRLRDLAVEYIVEDGTKFPSLKELELECLNCLKGFGKVEATGMFPHLHTLRISQCSLVILEDIKEMKSLAWLYLGVLPELTELPECSTSLVTSLRHLHFYDCPKLTSLPHGIEEMENLKSLWIYNCPELEKRCQRERGEDWHKIAHIPDVFIR